MPDRIVLKTGWQAAPAVAVCENAQDISAGSTKYTEWHDASLPTTVLALLVRDGSLPDPGFGDAIRSIPDGQFHAPWWFRTTIRIPAAWRHRLVWLHLDGINYRADVWINGRLVADHTEVEGTYRRFRFPISDLLGGGENHLAIKVYPPTAGDLALGFADWNPPAPDQNLGIWQDVSLVATDALAIRHPQVAVELPSPELARLTVRATLVNADARHAASGVLEGTVAGIPFRLPVRLAAGETREVSCAPVELRKPRLWWPHGMGKQHLYDLRMRVSVGGTVSDSTSLRFGVRSVTSSIDGHGHRQYAVNGREFQVRGGGFTDDLLLRHDPARTEALLLYARDMGLNTLRLEGIFGQDDLYEGCDRLGILLMVGWTCHWEWEIYIGIPHDEHGCIKSPRNQAMAVSYLRDQVRRLRHHPSILMWMYGSDVLPRPELERAYLDLLCREDPDRPTLACAAGKESPLSGPTGVKMRGPYDYVPPFYYYCNRDAGGAFGFATEEGPGAMIPRLESMRRMLPADRLWPINDTWCLHSSTRGRRDIDTNTLALEMQYGKAIGVADYCAKSQHMQYDAARALFEAWGRNRASASASATGIIAWMFNSSWPSVNWQLFSYDLLPGGAYYGVKKACEPLHAQYSYDDGSVWVIHEGVVPRAGLRLTARIVDARGRQLDESMALVDVAAQDRVRAFALTPPRRISAVFFVHLTLTDAAGERISANTYALSRRAAPGLVPVRRLEAAANPAAYNPFKKKYRMQVRPLADLRSLTRLPPARLRTTIAIRRQGAETLLTVALENRSSVPAFFLEVTAIDAQGEPLTPVFWDDNYPTLMSGERIVLHGSVRHAGPVRATVSGWNVRRMMLTDA